MGDRTTVYAVLPGRGYAQTVELNGSLEQPLDSEADGRLAGHLRNQREHLFPFLYCPGLAATNHQAEQAIRGMVIARKVWGGNRTANGSRTQSLLMSLLRTCRQQGQAAMPWLMSLLCAALALPLNLT